MAKRFINTDIWDKGWFADLSPKMKIVWVYLFTKCDHAGVFEPNLKFMSFLVGVKVTMDEITEHLGEHIIPIENTDKWLIKDFIPFQYKLPLNPNSKPHLSVINILEKYNINETLIEGLDKGLTTLKDKDMDKYMDINQDKKKELVKDKVTVTNRDLIESHDLADLADSDEFSRKSVFAEYEKFKDYCSANGKKYKNYKSAFKNWLRAEWCPDKPVVEKTPGEYSDEQLKRYGIEANPTLKDSL